MEEFFVCYSGVTENRVFALRLADELAAGPPPYRVWLDVRDLQPGEDWDVQVAAAIRDCRGLLFLMTEDSVMDDSECKAEWVRALKYRKAVIPLRVDPDAELPFRLGSRQFIDFTGGFASGVARLRKHLAWMDTPEGAMQELRDRLGDAKRELRRASGDRQSLFEREIRDLQHSIEEQERLGGDAGAVADRPGRG